MEKRPLDSDEVSPPKIRRQNVMQTDNYEYDSYGRNLSHQQHRQNKEKWTVVNYKKKNKK